MVFDSCAIYSNKQIMITMFSTSFPFFSQWKNPWEELLNGEFPFALAWRWCRVALQYSRATWRSRKMHYHNLLLMLNPWIVPQWLFSCGTRCLWWGCVLGEHTETSPWISPLELLWGLLSPIFLCLLRFWLQNKMSLLEILFLRMRLNRISGMLKGLAYYSKI